MGGSLVGATVEERGFDETVTAGGLLALIEGAWRAVPAIEELPVAETWVGFRPGSRDDAPMLGPSGVDGLVDRYRASPQRDPVDPGDGAGDQPYVLTGRLADSVRPFSPERFASSPAPLGPALTAGPALARAAE